MRIKDSTIICMLCLTLILVFCGALGAEQEIQRLEEQVAQLRGDFEDFSTEVTAELAEHEDRLQVVEHHQDVIDARISRHYKRLLSLENQVNTHAEKIEKIEKHPKASNSYSKGNKYNLKISSSDKRLMASLVFLESGAESYRCQKAVASVLVNRMVRYHKTARQAIYEKGVFSVAYKVASTKPSASCVRAVNDVLTNGTTLPLRVTSFRNGHYHRNFGKPYCRIDNVYFSLV